MIGKRAAASLVACLVVAACGSSGKQHATTSTSSSASAPAGPPPGLSGVRGRVLAANEMKGFVPAGRRALGTGAASWVVVDMVPAAQRAAEMQTLERLGFVAGVRENLTSPNGVAGLSTVEQFRSAGSARVEVVNYVKSAAAPPFAVPDISGARGFGAAGSGFNIVFAKGPYVYFVGAEAPPGGPTRSTVIAAAQHLDKRVTR